MLFAFIFLLLFIIVIRLLTDSMCSHAGSIPFMSIGVRILLIDREGPVFSKKNIEEKSVEIVPKIVRNLQKKMRGVANHPSHEFSFRCGFSFSAVKISNPNLCLRHHLRLLIG